LTRDDTVLALSYAVRLPVLFKYLGQLALALAVLTAVPLLVALWFRDYAFAGRLALVLMVAGGVGAVLSRLPAPERMQVNEALVITALAFFLSALLMSWPLMAAGLGFGAALFEAISAVTTTGLSSQATVEGLPPAFHFTRAWMQWYGGLGIVVLTVALLMGHRLATHRLVDPELHTENLATTTRHYARRMLLVYVVLSVAGLFLLMVAGTEPFSAVTHTLSAISTGGFSPFDSSLAALPPAAQAVVSLLAVAGAVALPLHYVWFTRGAASFLDDVELRTLLVMLLFVCLLLAGLLGREGMAPGEALRHGVLLGISAQTTAGFSSLDVGTLGDGSKLALMLAMIGGGSIGSTAGGIKLLRLLVLWHLCLLALRRTSVVEHAVVQPWIGNRRLEHDDIERALLLILLFVLVIVFSWLPFLVLGYDAMDALFEVISATGTVGLSSGLSGAGLPPLLQGILCFDMLAGRVEIVALLVVLFPATWFGKRAAVT
jgi:trk system potassium uptake protein TrkH